METFISDLIPILGYMDDAAVLHQVFNTVEKDLNDYIALNPTVECFFHTHLKGGLL